MSTPDTRYFGSGANRFSVHYDWLKFPQTPLFPALCDVQGLAEDPETGELYVAFAENTKGKNVSVEPAVLVFDAEGNYLRRFAPDAHRGGHGVRFLKIGKEKFVFVTCVNTCKVYKYNALTGELLLTIDKPSFYGAAKFKPTNVAPLPDGRFAVTDGYGSNYILLYSASGDLISYFNGTENENPGAFNQPHGIHVLDEQNLVIADRKKERLVLASFDGSWQSAINAKELRHPCNIHPLRVGNDVQYLIPGLWHSIGIYDFGFNLVIRLGDGYSLHRQGVASSDRNTNFRKALESDDVSCSAISAAGFLYPHDAIWTISHGGRKGNILVCEWNYHIRGTGVTLLRRCPE